MRIRSLKAMILFLFSANALHAQLLASLHTEAPFIDFLGKTGTAFWTAETYREKSFIHKLYINSYDWNLKQLSSSEIEDAHYEHTAAFMAFDKVIVTDKQMDGEDRKYFIRNIFSGGENQKADREIFNINCWKENKKLNSDGYDFFSKVSTTGQHVVFIYENDYRDDLPNEVKVRVMTPDDSLSEIRILQIPYGCNLAETRNYIFDDVNGQQLHVLVTIFDKGRSKKRKAIRTELFTFDLETGNQKLVEIPVGSDYSACKMVDGNGMLLCGFFKKETEENLFTGVKFAVVKDSVLFTGDVDLDAVLSGKFKFLKGRPDTYKIRTLDLNGENKIFAIVEKNNREWTSSGAPMMGANGAMMMPGTVSIGGNTTTYTAEDLYLLGVDLNGQHKFSQEIKKNQSFIDQPFVSYLYLKGDKKTKVVFTDYNPFFNDVEAETAVPVDEKAYKMNCYSLGDSLVSCKFHEFTNEFFDKSRKFRLQNKSYVRLNDDTFVIAATIKMKESYLIKLKLTD